MATEAATKPPEEAALEGGSYEVLSRRLSDQGRALAEKTARLNEARIATFGGVDFSVVGNVRVRTEHNCVPRDIVPIGGRLLFGYNVFLGLKKETRIADVLSVHTFEESTDGFDLPAEPLEGSFLDDPAFKRDFEDLYRYYAGTRLDGFRRRDSKLLAAFRVGAGESDLKILRWSIDPDGRAKYLDSRGEREWVLPPSHDFEWTPTTREDQVQGRHPHVSILDEVFVETIGGDLTIKVEDNTEDGTGLYAEPVDDPSQGLDDAEIQWAKLGVLILIRILPYREQTWRYLVFNTRTRHVRRIDAIGQACLQLPEDHGIIFPGGYYLQTGDHKLFDVKTAGLKFKRTIRSPNGEDVLYVFHRASDGHYLLFPYNLVRKEVQNPINCHGYSIFADGRMAVFRARDDEPTRVHPMQVWQTPFVSAEFAARAPSGEGYLAKVGNADLVRGISDAYTVVRMIGEEAPTRRHYEDLLAQVQRVVDAYYWIAHEETQNLAAVLSEIRLTAELVVDEFEKVVALRRRAGEVLAEAETQVSGLLASIRPDVWGRVEDYLEGMTKLRQERGHVISVKETRYIDLTRLEALEAQLVERFESVSRAAVDFLLRDEAFAPLRHDLEKVEGRIDAVKKSAEIGELAEDVGQLAEGLSLLGETVGGLEVDDPTARTRILEGISEIFSLLNRVRAGLERKRQEIRGREGRAEFTAQLTLFAQSVENGLSVADTPERCDEQLSRVLLALEELESRFSDLDEFAAQLTERREEVYEAFNAKKQALREARQKRCDGLVAAAGRIFDGIGRRSRTFTDTDGLNAYFASDPMIQKLRKIVEQLTELGDSVRADEIESKLKTARQDALRGQRDRADLFEGGTVRLGRHRFSVSSEALELTLVPRGDAMTVQLAATDFQEPLDDPQLTELRDLWDQPFVSETAEIYRGEFLAVRVLRDAEAGARGLSMPRLREAALSDAALLELVRDYAADRYDEGYERGVHDADAARILGRLLAVRDSVGLLRFPPTPRALAALFWAFLDDPHLRAAVRRRAASLGRLRRDLAYHDAVTGLGAELSSRIGAFLQAAAIGHSPTDLREAGRYLVEELAAEAPRFVTSADAAALHQGLLAHLDEKGTRHVFDEDLRGLDGRLSEAFDLARTWVSGFIASPSGASHQARAVALVEAAVLALTHDRLDREVSSARTAFEVTGLAGTHGRLPGGVLELRLDEVLQRVGTFIDVQVPRYRTYRKLVSEIAERERHRLRIDELKPRVLSSFVRNQLLDEVYLPLIGDNLAKQLGAAGADRRTDQMGLLLLISPPGYGKTTLMEYVASTLGLVFMKVNGPALGHSVVSLDPAEAPNATARQEVDKINLALEMGNNVMLYLDDIQHTNPELLQKFISLCDAQRRIEGVWKGRTRTYDLRGKRFCVVMAGNPYTEAGARFQIPDMLANRADTYNLGDILSGREDLFAQSYIENALTSNAVLAPLSTREPKDVRLFLRMARGEEVATGDLSYGYSAAEIAEITTVLRHLSRVRDVLLQVNATYISSAAQDDRFRTEPRFQLQGSYRNMAKVAEKIVPAMNVGEIDEVVDDHYDGEAQTLTTGAEHNLLKLAELRGRLTDEARRRWTEIKRGFARDQVMGGSDEDPAVRALGVLTSLGDRIDGVREAIGEAAHKAPGPDEGAALTGVVEALRALRESVREAAAASKPAPRTAPPVDLGPVIEALRAAPAVDLGPVVEALRSPPAIDLAPVIRALEGLAGRPTEVRLEGGGAASSDTPAGWLAQLKLVEEALLPLKYLARHKLQSGEGTLKAMQVWHGVNEALDLIKSAARRGSGA